MSSIESAIASGATAHTPPSLGVVYASSLKPFYYRRAYVRAVAVDQDLRTYVQPTGRPTRIEEYRPGSIKHGYLVVAALDDTVTDETLFERAALLRQRPPAVESEADGMEVFVTQGPHLTTWEQHQAEAEKANAAKRKASRERAAAARKHDATLRRIAELHPGSVDSTSPGYVAIQADELLSILERAARTSR